MSAGEEGRLAITKQVLKNQTAILDALTILSEQFNGRSDVSERLRSARLDTEFLLAEEETRYGRP